MDTNKFAAKYGNRSNKVYNFMMDLPEGALNLIMDTPETDDLNSCQVFMGVVQYILWGLDRPSCTLDPDVFGAMILMADLDTRMLEAFEGTFKKVINLNSVPIRELSRIQVNDLILWRKYSDSKFDPGEYLQHHVHDIHRICEELYFLDGMTNWVVDYALSLEEE